MESARPAGSRCFQHQCFYASPVGFLAGEATQGECNSLADSCIILTQRTKVDRESLSVVNWLRLLSIEHSNSGKKVLIRFDSRYRINFFDSIGNLINLPLVL